MPAHGLHAVHERIQVVAVVGDVLAGVVAVPVDEGRHLRLLRPIDAFDERDAEFAVVDAPDLHAAVGVAGPGIVDPLDQDAAFNLDMEPGPAFDRARFNCVSDVVDLPQVGHRDISFPIMLLPPTGY